MRIYITIRSSRLGFKITRRSDNIMLINYYWRYRIRRRSRVTVDSFLAFDFNSFYTLIRNNTRARFAHLVVGRRELSGSTVEN